MGRAMDDIISGYDNLQQSMPAIGGGFLLQRRKEPHDRIQRHAIASIPRHRELDQDHIMPRYRHRRIRHGIARGIEFQRRRYNRGRTILPLRVAQFHLHEVRVARGRRQSLEADVLQQR